MQNVKKCTVIRTIIKFYNVIQVLYINNTLLETRSAITYYNFTIIIFAFFKFCCSDLLL